MKTFLLRLALFLTIIFLISEIIFRWVIPAREMPFACVDPEYGLLKYDTTHTRTGLFTVGRTAAVRVPWHINNHGWNCPLDYVPRTAGDGLNAAILGDSYIEGMYVSWNNHVANQLDSLLGGHQSVYSFGYAGVPFSEYFRMSRYVLDKFHPRILILLVGGGDLVGSLANLAPNPYAMQYKWTAGDSLTVTRPRTYQPGLGRLLRLSATVRYLTGNADLALGLGMGDNAVKKDIEPEEIERQSRLVARRILEDLRQTYPETKFILLVDADRKALYKDPSQPCRLLEAEILEPLCKELGVGIVDLAPRFQAEYQATGVKLNFDYNYHWNARANQLAAEELHKWIQSESANDQVQE
jgi:hypothetical protein